MPGTHACRPPGVGYPGGTRGVLTAGPVLLRGGIAAQDHRRNCPRRPHNVRYVWEDQSPENMVLPRPHKTAFARIAPGLGDWLRLKGLLA